MVQPFLHVSTRALPLPSGHVEERVAKAQDYLEGVARRLREDGLEVEVRVITDASPATAILNAAQAIGADLVAMSTHGYRGIARAVLGSVADKVLRGSAVPVLIERPEMQHLE